MGDKDVASSGDKAHPKVFDVTRRVASAVSGSLSGTLIGSIVQPFDVIRTRMQADAIHGKYRSTVATLRTVVSESGVRGLWRGTPATVLRLSLGAGTHFFLLDILKPIIESHSSTGSLGLGGAALAGGLSRGLATVALSPITLIKTRLEATGTFGLDSSRSMATVAGEVIRTQGSAVPQAAVNFTSGVLAAMVATLVTQPTDVLRARVQLGVASGFFSAAKSAVKGQDSIPRTFLTGAMPRFLKRTVQTALIWTLYEEIMPVIYSILSAR